MIQMSQSAVSVWKWEGKLPKTLENASQGVEQPPRFDSYVGDALR